MRHKNTAIITNKISYNYSFNMMLLRVFISKLQIVRRLSEDMTHALKGIL